MIDCHIHILPGIDDGPSQMDEALLMAEQAYQSGVDALIVTPHSNQLHRFENYYGHSLIESYETFKTAVKEHGNPINIYLGMEIYVTEDILDQIKSGKLIGLNKTNYYLIEFSFHEAISYIEYIVNELLANHYIPILAHPERYTCYQREPWQLYRLIKAGCMIQLNKDSILGFFGRNVQKTAKKLLDHRLVHIIASDAHDSVFRHAGLSEIQDYLEYHYGMEYTHQLLVQYPYAVIMNKRIIF